MKQIGFLFNTSDKEFMEVQETAFRDLDLDDIYERTSDASESFLLSFINNLSAGDQVIFYDLSCIGKSVIQLSDFLNYLSTKGINLVILDKGIGDKEVSDEAYIQMLLKVADMEKEIIRDRTTRGLQKARKNGRVGGRPKISNETIEQIRYLYNNNRYTLREIAEECNISLGTAYKYVQEG